jgi:hypothetical protein
MSLLALETTPSYFDNDYKAIDSNDTIPANVIEAFNVSIGNGNDITLLRSAILKLFGSVLKGMHTNNTHTHTNTNTINIL